MKSKIELESMFDNAQTMHLQEFINYYTPDTTNTGTVTGGELLELNLSSLLHTLNDGNDVLLKADSNWPEILTQLKQQLSSLQAENERLNGLVATDIGVEFKMETEIAALKADNERLRVALKELLDRIGDEDLIHYAIRGANAALKNTEI